MENQRVLKMETNASSSIKQNYVAPKSVSYSIQSEGMLCSSNVGSVPDPDYGGSTGFDSYVETSSMWD